ncbi:chromate efflux transporter [Limnohabitans sp. 63ED37-2]|uniref:chromate efflux transporter n=1 Tax=Limnohabitans sp. 63ED37-2 TaxID=1678128 RepID=UPI000705D9EB|nr:chromate efflux transporter [Limnohabitans sp. 63ED37-2]ALK88938.1 putative chromate transport protein [Limnohabitans sp. 63ED37-2]
MTAPQAVTQVHKSHTQSPTVSWREALKFWCWLGCMSFGGPAGQIALMHEELVVRRRWMSEKRYLHALNYCMLLPGPEAQQLATYMGWLMHGTRGGIAAGALFVLPSLVLLIVLSWAYTAWGQHPWGQALLWGLKPAVTALVLQAAHRLALRTLKARWLWVLAVLALLGMLWGLPAAVIILGAAVTGYVVSRQALSPPAPDAKPASPTPASNSAPAWLDDDTPPPPHTHYSHPRLVRALAIGVGLWALSLGLIVLVFGLGHTLTQMGGFFTQAAFLTFGGAYAVLPMVTQAAVVHYGWLNAAQMMDGLALGESTPGPLIMVVAFVGFLGGHSQALFGHPVLGGVVAACVVTWFTFLPSFVFILAGGPLVESTRHMPSLTGPLQGIMAAVIGMIVYLAGVFARQTWLPGGWHMLPDLGAMALTVLATWLLIRKQLSVFKLLGLCTVLGLVWQLWV